METKRTYISHNLCQTETLFTSNKKEKKGECTDLGVFGVGNEPVNRRKMLPLSKLLI
jgi:hypothetical protein